ncbi:uncharacterized protein L3040_007546 [Drepanopeziza brunnea f. sp. 'multigermtubi']|uniref:uncharacterized protein n=1 Tax=Drepanopeziza brunnea f. sp. 'multigermtubi' TaxID=698441 RepID=UPI0023839B47|nr:hypothetical protein L3040_007546 [Drepanopeziza brunnea f. sp. 'multigermtubi']
MSSAPTPVPTGAADTPAAASSPQPVPAGEPASTPARIITSADTPHVEELFEVGKHEYNVHDPSDELASETDNLLICTACGTQFDEESRSLLARCRICDDPRQFVPPTGQAFTTMAALRAGPYKNRWTTFDDDPDENFWQIWTEPHLAIGQRAILVRTPQGNILWDCIAFLDSPTIDFINELGGLAAIVISHPHYYTTHLEWADIFECPVYLAWEDKSWLNRFDRLGKVRTFIQSTEEEIEVRGEKTGVVILKPGGHFPGSLVALAHNRLLIADTLVTTPSGRGDWSRGADGGVGRPAGMNTYVFMWSIPNMIPLAPDVIAGMWKVLKGHKFHSTHGAFVGTDVRDGSYGADTTVKERILESIKIQIEGMGWKDHALLKETCE